MKDGNLLILYDFNEKGLNFCIEKETFLEYHQFMNIVDNVTDILVLDKGFSAIDLINAYDTTGMIPFISPNSYYKVTP